MRQVFVPVSYTHLKGITNANRISILRGFAQEFSVKAQVPDSFDGIPVLNNMAATFYYFIGDRQENDIENLWQVFVSALEYANTHSDSSKKAFVAAYDVASQQKGVKWNLTMALYWIRPYEYINLDSRNRWYICNPENMPCLLYTSPWNVAFNPYASNYSLTEIWTDENAKTDFDTPYITMANIQVCLLYTSSVLLEIQRVLLFVRRTSLSLLLTL